MATENPILPLELQQQVNLDSIKFVNNEQLASIIANTDASPEQKAEAMRINSEARLSAEVTPRKLRHPPAAEPLQLPTRRRPAAFRLDAAGGPGRNALTPHPRGFQRRGRRSP